MDRIISYIQGYWYLGLATLLLAIALLIFTKKRKRKKQNKTRKKNVMIDNMTLRRPTINTSYLERDFKDTIQKLVYSYYALNPQTMPEKYIDREFWQEKYNDMKREYEDLRVRRTINQFEMKEVRGVGQDTSMHAVTAITMEATFFVEYDYFDSTVSKKVQKEFSQRFVFINQANMWLLCEQEKEEIINKNEIEIQV